MNLDKRLREFAAEHNMTSKGPLSVALVVTRHAKKHGLPLNPEELLTAAGGQVRGLTSAAVQTILSEYGIERELAKEAGRTSRGSMGRMRAYATLLDELNACGLADLDFIEDWWIERVREYFAATPFELHFDTSKSLRSMVRDLLEQAEERQEEEPGATFVGTMLQHLIGAKLNLLGVEVEHHGASVADESSGREADFLVEDVAIHVTAAPNEALMRKCVENLKSGTRPLIITTMRKGTVVAEALAEQNDIADRVEVFEAEQFLAGNLYERGGFAESDRRISAEELVTEYNGIVKQSETDPSLLIETSW